MAHPATVLQPGDEMYVGFMHSNGKYVEVKLMAGDDVLQVESRDSSIHVLGGHRCQAWENDVTQRPSPGAGLED